jgi:hypothetical protein
MVTGFSRLPASRLAESGLEPTLLKAERNLGLAGVDARATVALNA